MADVATLGIGVDLSELRAATRELEKLEQAATKTEKATSKIGGLGNQAAGAGNKAASYGRQVEKAGQQTEQLGNKAKATAGLVGYLKKAFGAYVSLKTVQMIADIADRMQSLNNQIKLVTGSENTALAVRKELLAISNRTYADLEATGSLYVKAQRALQDYGYSQKQVLQFVEATNNAMRVGGVGAQEQAAALFQLSQALGSGRLQGDEFRSISEAAPILLDTLAEHLGKTRAEIRAMAADGKLTSDVIVEAVTAAGGKLAEQAGNMQVTLGGSLTVLKNNFAALVDEMLNGTGVMSVFAQGIKFIADNLQTFAQIIGVIGFTYLLQMLTAVQITAYNVGFAFGRLTAIMLANPFVAVAAALVAVLAATGELSNAMDALGVISKDVFGVIIAGYQGLSDLISAVYADMTAAADENVQQSTGIFGGFFDEVGDGFWGFLEGVGKVFDAMAALIVSAVEYMVNAFGDLWQAIKDGAAWAAKSALEWISKLVNGAIDGINSVIALANNVPGVNIGTVGKVNWGSGINAPYAFGERPSNNLGWSAIYGSRVESQAQGGLQNYFRGARARSAANNTAGGQFGGGGKRTARPSGGGGRKRGGGKSDAEKLQEQFNKELSTTREKLNAIKAEFTDMENYGFKNQFTTLREFDAELNKVGGRYSKFSEDQRKAIRNVYEQIHAQEQLNAVQAFHLDGKRHLEDMEFEVGLLGKSQAETERLRYARELDLKVRQQTAGMSPEYVAKMNEERDAILAQYDAIQRIKEERGEDWLGGIRDGVNKYAKSMGTLREQMADMVGNTFDTLGNTLGDFVATGKANFRDMTVSILQDLSKIFIRMATMRLVSSFAGGGGAFADGGAFNNGLQFFASGGVFTNQVVSRPTMFAHGGGFGVMGEAGPEAIMPLTRAPNGKLGVAAQGGSGVQNNVNISVSISQTGNAESDSKADSEQGRRIARMLDGKIIEVLVRESRPGGMLSNRQ
ncbi:tape measure protein [Eikenella corrodens]|uniref:tape measure protein n=1 Tax=Eikenella corrodens TaxID=539 RepID=UPI00129BC8CD|nr:tape measure protein [Eikenella corrodens]